MTSLGSFMVSTLILLIPSNQNGVQLRIQINRRFWSLNFPPWVASPWANLRSFRVMFRCQLGSHVRSSHTEPREPLWTKCGAESGDVMFGQSWAKLRGPDGCYVPCACAAFGIALKGHVPAFGFLLKWTNKFAVLTYPHKQEASSKILVPPAQAADITGLLSYLRPFGIVPLPPSPLRFLPPFLC